MGQQLREGISAFLLDLDGVVYRGGSVLPGAAPFFSQLQAENVPFLLVTNNSTRTPTQYVAKLKGMGITVDECQVLTSSLATASYLSDVASVGSVVYAIGEEGLRRALTDRGFRLADDGLAAAYVVAGHDSTLTWHKLAEATLSIRQGAPFIGTNPDRTLPTERGLVPGAGAILAALEAATGVKPHVVGKPAAYIFEEALAQLGTPPERVAMIGDRLDTDIQGAANAGLHTIALLSGVSSASDVASFTPAPGWVYEDLSDLLSDWLAT